MYQALAHPYLPPSMPPFLQLVPSGSQVQHSVSPSEVRRCHVRMLLPVTPSELPRWEWACLGRSCIVGLCPRRVFPPVAWYFLHPSTTCHVCHNVRCSPRRRTGQWMNSDRHSLNIVMQLLTSSVGSNKSYHIQHATFTLTTCNIGVI